MFTLAAICMRCCHECKLLCKSLIFVTLDPITLLGFKKTAIKSGRGTQDCHSIPCSIKKVGTYKFNRGMGRFIMG